MGTYGTAQRGERVVDLALAARRAGGVHGGVVGIDRFMSEARALTNFAGNAVATVLVGSWTGEFDRARAVEVLSGRDPFDETTLLDEHAPATEEPVPAAKEAAVAPSPA